MSREKKIGTNELGSAIGNTLYDFSVDVQYDVIKLTDEYADKMKKLIQEGAPVNKRKTKRRGKYKKSWRVKVTEDSLFVYEKTVCSPREYRLTHLLEKGHRAPRGGSNVAAQPHIQPAADKIKKRYVKGIEKIVQNSRRAGGGRTKRP